MTTQFQAPNPNFEQRVRASFRRQRVMDSLGAIMTKVKPGRVEIEMLFQEQWTQQTGFLHPGILTTLLDSACGYAALTLMPSDVEILSVEFKVNLLTPAVGDRMVAQARVLRADQSLTVCAADLFAASDMHAKQVATMLATMRAVRAGQSD